jgi:hypothetical protein
MANTTETLRALSASDLFSIGSWVKVRYWKAAYRCLVVDVREDTVTVVPESLMPAYRRGELSGSKHRPTDCSLPNDKDLARRALDSE